MLKDRLKKLREAKGLSQVELAARLDLSPGAIGGYENGSRLPKPQILAELAEFFDVTPEYLEHGPQLTPDQYAVFKEKITDALDNTSSDDLEAMSISERAVRTALRQRAPISIDRAADLAGAFGISTDFLATVKTASEDLKVVIEGEIQSATEDQLRRLLKYLELMKKGEL